MQIPSRTRTAAATAAFAVGAVGFGAIAGAATSKSHTTKHAKRSAVTGQAGPRDASETPLTGDTLTKANAAAEAAVSGGTAKRATTEDPAENTGAAYEVLVSKSDGSFVKVLEDSSFKVVKTQAGDHGPGGHGHHGFGGGNPNETALTGSDLTQAKSAAEAAVSGGTAQRATTEDPAENTGAAYEVLVTKSDGSMVKVLEDKSFKVVKTEAGGDHGHGPGDHGGPNDND